MMFKPLSCALADMHVTVVCSLLVLIASAAGIEVPVENGHPVDDCYSGLSQYAGHLNHTVGGRTCQKWSANYPHSHSYYDGTQFPEGDLDLAENYCRSPDGERWPWCYTTDPHTEWEFCPVKGCNGAAGDNNEPSGDSEPCFSNETPYAGDLSNTIGGLPCQDWVHDYPHEHDYHTYSFPDGNEVLAENNCRSPGDDNTTWPWCYTTDSNVRWQYCPVVGCHSVEEEEDDPEACYSRDSPYKGHLARTVTGKICQPWVTDYPHTHKYHNDSMFPGNSQVDAENFCRSPDGQHWPWCYTTDPNTEWEFCAVKGCDSDCFTNEGKYSGRVATTLSGRTCQYWSKDYPHEHDYTDNKFPDGSKEDAENYCRNPGDKFWQPWCYTTDPNIRWEYCPVKDCDEDESDVEAGDSGEPCFSEDLPYLGTVTKTIRGHTCQSWSRNYPHKHNYHKGHMYAEGSQYAAKNFCRNPDGVYWPWCYTTNPKVKWDYCHVEACDDDCFTNESPFAEPLKHTVGGHGCQPWYSNYPHEHEYHNDTWYPDGSQLQADNYCRNPGGSGWWPWCYTTDSNVRWDYCPVEGCYALDDVESEDPINSDCYSGSSQYAGSISHTIGGHSCQPWTSNYPYEHKYHNDTLYPEQSQAAAENFCRSPDGSHAPWCYTTDPTARWEYCPVDGCEYEEPSPEEPCFDDTALYSGKISHTISGRTCQPWISNYPHQHKFHNDTEYPGGSQVVAENFCRNLGEKKWWPWCYTTDPSVRWEYCPVKGCNAPEEIVEDCFTKPSSYLGQVSNTVSGTLCQHWVQDEPHKHEFHNNSFFPGETTETALNYCRSAGGKHWPWCYTTNPDVRWEFCPVNGCDQACFSNKRPYAGRQSKTISGRTCQPWVNNYPHEHGYHNGSMYPENSEIFAVNYCRNPDEKNWWPWCYTTDPEKRWEFCPMEACKYTFSCEQGWYHDEQAGYCYKSSAQYTTFQDAQTFCANIYNAHLPSVLDANSLSFLSSVIMRDRLHATWVGATNNYDEWKMLDGGQFGLPVQSRVLGSQKACAVFSPPVSIDTLYDDFCEDRWQFICQKQATSSLVTDEGGVL